MLTRYADKNGVVTRGAMEKGLRADFDKLDTGHKGCLSADQVTAENERRWQEDASTASPLIDWKQQGCVDFEEFATTPRSLFLELDRNNDGQLTPQELSAKGQPRRD